MEAHLLDAPTDLDLYGETLTLHFLDRIRPERRFSGADELVAQIRADIEAVRIRLDGAMRFPPRAHRVPRRRDRTDATRAT